MPRPLQPRLRLVASHGEPSAPPEATPLLDDTALIVALGRRDRAASAAFYARVRPIVDRTLSRLLGPRDPEYEDMAQAVLYELINTIGHFRNECPLDAWVSIVSARVVYRQIRRRRLERRFFGGSARDKLTLYSVPVPFASRQAVELVRAHLDRMDSKRTWTFLLHDVYGYNLEQIGRIMGTSVSAAQSRLVRGRNEIHERLQSDPELAHFLDDLSEDVP